MSGFVHLHVHSEYSLLDGACRITDLISKAKSMGQNAVALTDHGVMYGAVNFYKEAKKAGIKPIIGCEVYVAARKLTDKTKELDSELSHLVLLCKNEQGYKNLIKMVSLSFTDGFYFKPRVDIDLLKKYSDGLIALSACLAGKISRCLLRNDYNAAKETAIMYKEIFGEGNFYLELQDHGLPEQKRINPLIIKLSEQTDIPLVCSNDCHYIAKEDSKMHEILLCIQTNRTLEDENRMKFSSDEFYVKSEEEMRDLFDHVPKALENTVKIANMCDVYFEFGNTKLPHFEVPGNRDHFEYLKEMCYFGLYKRYGENPKESVISRLNYELGVISKMGYVDYYLIVHDFVRYAKDKRIPIGPGRGSGAGSIAAYCIGITDIDPIKYNLIFERFLNPERISMPDFDIDFCYERRSEVIDYVINKYGENHVAQIVTFGTMAARGAIRDAGRAMAIPYSEVDAVAKLIPMDIGATIEKSIHSSSQLENIIKTNKKIARLIDTAKKIEGMPRHASTHAAGVVITKDPVDSYVPLAKNDESIVTQYTMTTLEELGLLKIDFLGLRTLTVLNDTLTMINMTHPDVSESTIDYSDKNVYDMMSRGETQGVFQFESSGMRRVLMKLKPENIEDLIAVISLYRPGPMDSIPTYIENRHNPKKVSYKHPLLANILDVTYGCIVYQEQVMDIFRTLAGYSLGRADIVRRAMSKKKADVMKKEEEIFIHGLSDDKGNVVVNGCIRNGVPESIAKSIYSEMENFSQYAFNKSHAAAYAVLSYRTAWMRCYYPKEFMASLLTSVIDNSGKLIPYISDCVKMGIKVLLPHVNKSDLGFTVDSDRIRFGLLAVKNLGRNNMAEIINERTENGEFTSFYDFCKRMCMRACIPRKVFETLIRCGSIDDLGNNRREMLLSYEKILDELERDKKTKIQGQISFFDSPDIKGEESFKIPRKEEYSSDELILMEKDTMGVYLSSHPLLKYSNSVRNLNISKTSEITAYDEDEYKDTVKTGNVLLFGVIESVKLKSTKGGSTMAFIKLDDMYGTAEIIVFPKTLLKYSYDIRENNIVLLNVRIEKATKENTKIILEGLKPAENIDSQAQNKKNKRPGLYLKVPKKDGRDYKKIQNLIGIFDGTVPVYIFFGDTGKLVLNPPGSWVDLNDVLLRELRNILGGSNVAIVK